MSFVQVRNLDFAYPGRKILKDVSFSIARGGVTALVGPNGAGKTTLLRCIAALETPLAGSVTAGGIDVHDDPRGAHRMMGYLSDFFGLYDELTVRQCLTYMAWCHPVPRGEVPARVARVAEDTGIAAYLDARAGTLSRGYRQRLGVALAIVHEPALLLLDEPASGMDPEARVGFSDLILRLQARGMTIVVSSHILAELEDYCTDMLVIREGAVRSHVTLAARQAEGGAILRIGIRGATDDHVRAVAARPGVTQCRREGDAVICGFAGDDAARADLLAALVGAGMPVHSFVAGQKTLKAAYMDLAAGMDEEEREARRPGAGGAAAETGGAA